MLLKRVAGVIVATCLFVSYATADVFVITETGIWQVNDAGSVKIADKAKGDQVVIDGVPGPGPDPDPDPDPSDPLEKMVADAATLVDEPLIAATVSAGYQFATDQLKGGKPWDTVISAVNTFRGISVSRSQKKVQWTAMFASLDSELTKHPQTADTLQHVANGFKSAAQEGVEGQPIEWFKLLECLPCIFDAFTSEEVQALDKSQPSVLVRPVTMNWMPMNGELRTPEAQKLLEARYDPNWAQTWKAR